MKPQTQANDKAVLRKPVCSRCGHELYEDDEFCSSCGAKVERTSQNDVDWRDSTVPVSKQAEPDGDGTLGAIVKGTALAVDGVGKVISKLVSAVLVLIAGIWIYGAICAHNDVEKHQAIGIILQRMYGTEYNPLTRHGYRMYIKHFTTFDPEEETTAEDLWKRFESAAKETFEDLGAFFKEKGRPSGDDALYRLRENLADAAGNVARRNGNISDGVGDALGKFLVDAVVDAAKNNWENQSAEQLLETSVRYFRGDGVEKDARKAFEYCRRAAEKGNAMAQCNLGFFYESGEGVERNWSEAVKWYRKAADNGSQTARNKLKQIEEL